jgi:transposase-like protein
MMDELKEYNPEFIVKLIREHFEDQLSVDEISTRYGIQPELLAKWRKELLEGAVMIFSNPSILDQIKIENSIRTLKTRIKQKEKIILELEKDNFELKKMLCNINNEVEEDEY